MFALALRLIEHETEQEAFDQLYTRYRGLAFWECGRSLRIFVNLHELCKRQHLGALSDRLSKLLETNRAEHELHREAVGKRELRLIFGCCLELGGDVNGDSIGAHRNLLNCFRLNVRMSLHQRTEPVERGIGMPAGRVLLEECRIGNEGFLRRIL